MLLENTSKRLNRRLFFDTGPLMAATIELPDSYDESRGPHLSRSRWRAPGRWMACRRRGPTPCRAASPRAATRPECDRGRSARGPSDPTGSTAPDPRFTRFFDTLGFRSAGGVMFGTPMQQAPIRSCS
jgi:hypothetical protein